MARKGYNLFTLRNMLQEVMVDPAGSVVNNSCNQTTTSPKWIIIFFFWFSVKESKNQVWGWLQYLRACNERKTLRPPLLSLVYFCLPMDPKSSLIWQLRPRPYNGYLERGFDPIIIKLLLTGSV